MMKRILLSSFILTINNNKQDAGSCPTNKSIKVIQYVTTNSDFKLYYNSLNKINIKYIILVFKVIYFTFYSLTDQIKKNMDNISAVFENIQFMCMRLKNWDKGEGHRAFPQFCAE
jgi:hypothetical protein